MLLLEREEDAQREREYDRELRKDNNKNGEFRLTMTKQIMTVEVFVLLVETCTAESLWEFWCEQSSFKDEFNL